MTLCIAQWLCLSGSNFLSNSPLWPPVKRVLEMLGSENDIPTTGTDLDTASESWSFWPCLVLPRQVQEEAPSGIPWSTWRSDLKEGNTVTVHPHLDISSSLTGKRAEDGRHTVCALWFTRYYLPTVPRSFSLKTFIALKIIYVFTLTYGKRDINCWITLSNYSSCTFITLHFLSLLSIHSSFPVASTGIIPFPQHLCAATWKTWRLL